MTIDDLHGLLVRETFGRRLSDADAFLVFVLLHGYRVVLPGSILTDRPDVRELAALTQRSAAEALASPWAGTSDERADPCFWYHRWNGDWGGYAHAGRLSREEQERLGQLRSSLERHPFVVALRPED